MYVYKTSLPFTVLFILESLSDTQSSGVEEILVLCTNAERCHPKQGRSEGTNMGILLESRMAMVSMKHSVVHEADNKFLFKGSQ